MKKALLMCAMVPLCQGYITTSWRDLQANPSYSFVEYMSEYSKAYDVAEFATRRATFERNVKKIRAHNSGESSWKMGLNEFTDWEESEITQKRKGLVGRDQVLATSVHQRAVDIPIEQDWRKHGAVSPVKNQGGCGSCWAFSATEVLESHAAISYGNMRVLSPQQMVSCTPNPKECGGTGGCGGATQPLGFNYTNYAGLSLESDYPYTGTTGTCETSKIKPSVGNRGFTVLRSNDMGDLLSAVGTVGPVAVSVAANWGGYEEGVFNDSKCGFTVDHGVVVVGYGSNATIGLDYWIVRNSWGASWGEQGYIRIARDVNGKEPCGMDEKPTDGVACKGETTPIKYCGLCAILSASSYPNDVYQY